MAFGRMRLIHWSQAEYTQGVRHNAERRERLLPGVDAVEQRGGDLRVAAAERREPVAERPSQAIRGERERERRGVVEGWEAREPAALGLGVQDVAGERRAVGVRGEEEGARGRGRVAGEAEGVVAFDAGPEEGVAGAAALVAEGEGGGLAGGEVPEEGEALAEGASGERICG